MFKRDSKGRFIKGSVSTRKRNQKPCFCYFCEVEFYPLDWVKRKYCSKKCLDNSNYRVGRKMPTDKNANNWKYGCEDYWRDKARRLLNRYKPQNDNLIIHHIDGNIKNNAEENLEIMTRSEHTKLHWTQGDIR